MNHKGTKECQRGRLKLGGFVMNRIVLHSRVGADGVLQLTVPLGVADADREVEVTIEPAEPDHLPRAPQEDWEQFVRETAGAWQGELLRPAQGDYERRDELP
jgi:hypothetical protein